MTFNKTREEYEKKNRMKREAERAKLEDQHSSRLAAWHRRVIADYERAMKK